MGRPLFGIRNGLRVAGHPLHAMLVHFPLALWSLVFPLEALGAWTGWSLPWLLAYAASAAGSGFALPAAFSGLMDLIGLKDRPRESALANLHMLVMVGALALFGLELYFRHGPGPAAGMDRIVILVLSASGTLLLLWGGWLGGELVFRHGVGRETEKPG